MRTAAIVGFTPLERAGLVLLLAEHQVNVVETLDNVEQFHERGPAVHADSIVVDLASATRHRTAREALPGRLVDVRAIHPHTSFFGLYQSSSRHVISPDIVELLDALVDADARPESLVALIVGSGSARRAWRKPVISAAPLTSREQQILHLIAAGNTSKGVAATLGISMHTVDNHKQRIFRRLGVQNQAQAVAVAVRLGLLDDRAHHRGAAS